MTLVDLTNDVRDVNDDFFDLTNDVRDVDQNPPQPHE
jgi:hypothetical protein